ncbi:MAG: SPOR domain-containing protein [Sediminicola sp.]
MGTEHYIAELLYRYNCVIIPGFGGFLTQLKSAVIHEGTNSFSPPRKLVSFNGQLISNDGLLVSHMADAEKVGYEEMLERTHKVAEDWKRKLNLGERISLPNVGELWMDKDMKILFQPSYHINYLTSSFGFSPFVSNPVLREQLKEEIVEMEERIPFMITPESRKEGYMRPYLKYAAIILLAFSTGLTGVRFYKTSKSNQQLEHQEAQERVSRTIQEATFFGNAPLELPALKLEIAKKNQVHYYVVAGGFRAVENAEKKVAQLKAKGYNADYIGENKHGLHLVTYNSFTDAQEALVYLRQIKRTVSYEAWLYQE